MLNEYPNLLLFLDKHRLAQQNNSKEVRFTLTELNDAVHDIHRLMISVNTQHEDYTELKSLLSNLTKELKELSTTETDGGQF